MKASIFLCLLAVMGVAMAGHTMGQETTPSLQKGAPVRASRKLSFFRGPCWKISYKEICESQTMCAWEKAVPGEKGKCKKDHRAGWGAPGENAEESHWIKKCEDIVFDEYCNTRGDCHWQKKQTDGEDNQAGVCLKKKKKALATSCSHMDKRWCKLEFQMTGDCKWSSERHECELWGTTSQFDSGTDYGCSVHKFKKNCMSARKECKWSNKKSMCKDRVKQGGREEEDRGDGDEDAGDGDVDGPMMAGSPSMMEAQLELMEGLDEEQLDQMENLDEEQLEQLEKMEKIASQGHLMDSMEEPQLENLNEEQLLENLNKEQLVQLAQSEGEALAQMEKIASQEGHLMDSMEEPQLENLNEEQLLENLNKEQLAQLAQSEGEAVAQLEKIASQEGHLMDSMEEHVAPQLGGMLQADEARNLQEEEERAPAVGASNTLGLDKKRSKRGGLRGRGRVADM